MPTVIATLRDKLTKPSEIALGTWTMLAIMSAGTVVVALWPVFANNDRCGALRIGALGLAIFGAGPVVGGSLIARSWRVIPKLARIILVIWISCGVGIWILGAKLVGPYLERC